MDKVTLGNLIKLGSIIVGIITALVLVTRHPVIISLLGLEAAAYFIGEYITKN